MRNVLICLALLGSLMAAAASFPLDWPAPPGFKKETIPFPLDFAPSLRYAGVEELRFAPGFGKPDAPDYFTYCFIWLLDRPVELDLQHDLVAYFDGLMTAVASEKHAPPAGVVTRADVRKGAEPSGPDFPAMPQWTATVSTWDAFFTQKPLRLKLNVFEVPCPIRGKREFYFEVSPALETQAIRSELLPLRGALQVAPKR